MFDEPPLVRIHHGEPQPAAWRDRTDEVMSMLWLGVAVGWFAGLAAAGVLWLVVAGGAP